MKIIFQTINNSEYKRIIDNNYCIHVNYFIRPTILENEYIASLNKDNKDLLDKIIFKICELRYNNSSGKINLFMCISNFINFCIIDDTVNNVEKLISIITIK